MALSAHPAAAAALTGVDGHNGGDGSEAGEGPGQAKGGHLLIISGAALQCAVCGCELWQPEGGAAQMKQHKRSPQSTATIATTLLMHWHAGQPGTMFACCTTGTSPNPSQPCDSLATALRQPHLKQVMVGAQLEEQVAQVAATGRRGRGASKRSQSSPHRSTLMIEQAQPAFM